MKASGKPFLSTLVGTKMKLLSKTYVRTISAVISTFKCAIVIELMTQQRLPLIILASSFDPTCPGKHMRISADIF